MLPFRILKNIVTICLVLFLVALVRSQTTSDYLEEPSRFRNCSSSSYCIPIRRCLSFREGWKRRGVGITCGYGIGPYRMVCCPRSQQIEVSVRQTRRPRPTTPVPTPDTGNSEDCGQSQEIDWFRDHAENETDALEATWPWMVAIVRWTSSNRTRQYECSGFLISKIHVMSAAQCFHSSIRNSEPLTFGVRIGSDEHDLAEEYLIREIKVPEDYNVFHKDNDIAILTLAREVKTPNVVPICLPDERIAASDLTGWGATVLGWGRETNDGPASEALKQLDDVPILSNSECSQIYKESLLSNVITEDMMCAGITEGARDACSGDAGGPLMILYKKRWYAVGITSFGVVCGDYGYPGGYTRITSYMDWIRQNMRTANTAIIQPL